MSLLLHPIDQANHEESLYSREGIRFCPTTGGIAKNLWPALVFYRHNPTKTGQTEEEITKIPFWKMAEKKTHLEDLREQKLK